MVKFVASVGVNINQLQGLQDLLDGNYTINLNNISTTSVTLEADSIKFKITGQNFNVNGADLSGTVTGIEARTGGNTLYKATNFNLDISKVADATSLSAFLKDLLKGNDTLIGSNDDDTLRGFAGKDTLDGKGGKDTLIGDSGADNLRGGDNKDNLKGNGGVDKLNGGRGSDDLNGGKGSDDLNGGKGLDHYIFKDAPGHGVDTITNFQVGETIEVDNADFAGIGATGTLQAKFFVQARDAQDGDDHFVYYKGKGKLFYDHDGNGVEAKVLFAKVDPGTSLDHNDFLVI